METSSSTQPQRYENELYMTPSSASATIHTTNVNLAQRRMSSLAADDTVVSTVSTAASRARFNTYVEPDTNREIPPSMSIEARQHRLSSIIVPRTSLIPIVPSSTQNLTQSTERLEAETTFDHPVRTSLVSLLRALYRKVEPSKLEQKAFLSQVLDKYNGYEDLLASRLSAKYSDRAPEEIAALTRWIRTSQNIGNLRRRESAKGFVEARADGWVRANLSSPKHPIYPRPHDLDSAFLSRTPDIYASS